MGVLDKFVQGLKTAPPFLLSKLKQDELFIRNEWRRMLRIIKPMHQQAIREEIEPKHRYQI